MPYDHILGEFYRTPLAITEEKFFELREFLHAKWRGDEISAERVREIAAARRDDGVQMVGRVALVPVFGVLSQRVSALGEASGGVSAEALGARLDSLVNDKAVRSIVMVFDSPGGSVNGIDELAAKIRGYNGVKKVVGVADSVAASAAYWLISQTQEINVTPGGQVGSIGVISAHEDVSKKLESKGQKVTVVTAGKYKAEDHPFGPLSDEARSEMQGKVDHYYGMMVGTIAKGRGVSEGKVRADFGQGRMLTAKAAVARGMADHVATLEQVLRRLGAEQGAAGASALSGDQVRARSRLVELEA